MSTEGYGIIPDEEIERIEAEVVAYLQERKRQGAPGCASLSDLAEHIRIDKNRLLRYAKGMMSVDVIKPAQIMLSATGFTVTDDWYISLKGEDCFGAMASTVLREIEYRKQLQKAIEYVMDLPQAMDSLSKELKELDYDILGLKQEIGKVAKKINEIYEILTKGGVKHGRRRKEQSE